MNSNNNLPAVKKAVEVLEKALEVSKKHGEKELAIEIDESISDLKTSMSSKNESEHSKMLVRALHLIKIIYLLFGE